MVKKHHNVEKVIKAIQEAIGAKADGIYGRQTQYRLTETLKTIEQQLGMKSQDGVFNAETAQEFKEAIKAGRLDAKFGNAVLALYHGVTDVKGNRVTLTALNKARHLVGHLDTTAEGQTPMNTGLIHGSSTGPSTSSPAPAQAQAPASKPMTTIPWIAAPLRHAAPPASAPASQPERQATTPNDPASLYVPGLDIAHCFNPDLPYGKTATRDQKPYNSIVLHVTGQDNIKDALEYCQAPDKNRGGSQYGYSFLIDRNGNVYQTAPLNVRTNHILPDDKSFSNKESLGVALVGADGGATPEQKKAAAALVESLQNRFGISGDRVVGHGQIQNDRAHGFGPSSFQGVEGADVAAYIKQQNSQTVMAATRGVAADDSAARLAAATTSEIHIAPTRPDPKTVTPDADFFLKSGGIKLSSAEQTIKVQPT